MKFKLELKSGKEIELTPDEMEELKDYFETKRIMMYPVYPTWPKYPTTADYLGDRGPWIKYFRNGYNLMNIPLSCEVYTRHRSYSKIIEYIEKA